MKNTERAEILSAISGTKSFDELGTAIVEECAKVFNAEVCTLWRCYTDEKNFQKIRLWAASAKAPRSLAQEITYEIRSDPKGQDADGVTGFVAQTQQEVHVSSFKQLRANYDFCWKGRMDKTQWAGEPQEDFKSLSAFPLLLGTKTVGVLKLENKRDSTGGFLEKERLAVREFTPDIALAVHSQTLLENHAERLIQVPAEMVGALLQPFDPNQLVNETVKTVAQILQAEICSLWLVNLDRNELRLADGIGFSTSARNEKTYSLSDPSVEDGKIDGITAWVAIRKQPFWANSWEDLKAHPSWRGKWDDDMWHSRHVDFRCLYAVPLLRRDSVIGVLKVENRKGEALFTVIDRALCGVMASLIVLVLGLGQQLRDSLISDLAHLIRSPIGQVPMNLQGLEKEILRFQSGKKFRFDMAFSYLDFIKRALLSAVITSRNLVDVAKKVGSLTDQTMLETVSLTELVGDRVKEIRPLLYNGIRIKAESLEMINPISVKIDVTDRTRVQMAIDNILHNAIKYSNKNGIVEVGINRDSDFATIRIKDSGVGISEEDIDNIWRPNFSRRAPGHPLGTGMGLTMVKQVVTALGWESKVESRENKGTIFYIKIPLSKE